MKYYTNWTSNLWYAHVEFFYVSLFSTFSIFVTNHSKHYICHVNLLHFHIVEKITQRVDTQKKGKERENVGGGPKGCFKCYLSRVHYKR